MAPKPDRLVTAHFMLGNTYSYTPDVWTKQISLAINAGIDAFALNLGTEDWQLDQALSALSIVLSTASAFSLFLSLDMNVLSSSSLGDAVSLKHKVISLYRAHTSILHYLGRPVLSTFGGGDCLFGGMGWVGFLQSLREAGLDVFFIPAFFKPPLEIEANPCVQGVFSWNSAWPLNEGPIKPSEEDKVYSRSKKPSMMAVSPFFYAHYGSEPPWGWNKNWIYASDEALYPSRWEQIIKAKPELVQILSWNDYGESHYLGPIEHDQPGSNAWTDGMSHEALLSLTLHFSHRYKGIKAVEDEAIWISYRTHPAHVSCSGDPVGPPRHLDRAKDLISIYSSLSEKTELHISSTSLPSNKVIKLGRGSSTTLVPFSSGSISFEALRKGKVVGKLEGRPIEAEPLVHNYNHWVGRLSVS